jgi:hypothetical protein
MEVFVFVVGHQPQLVLVETEVFTALAAHAGIFYFKIPCSVENRAFLLVDHLLLHKLNSVVAPHLVDAIVDLFFSTWTTINHPHVGRMKCLKATVDNGFELFIRGTRRKR